LPQGLGKDCACKDSAVGPFGCAQGKLRRMGGHLWLKVIQPVSAWLVKAERVRAGPSQDEQVQFL